MAGAHVFVEDLQVPLLGADDRHHLERVLRLRAGEAVSAADGQGGWRECRYLGTGRLEPLGESEWRPYPEPAVTVAFALTKGDKPEWTVQKLTEAGVDRIVPMVSARSVVRWDADKAARNGERLRAVVRAASMQSRRVRLPVVDDLRTFAEVLADVGPVGALAHPGGDPPGLDRPAVLVGPEGGWADEELAGGLPTVGLGPTVLRAESAAMAAGLLLCALRAGVVAEIDRGRPG